MHLSGQRDFAIRLALEVAKSPGNFCLSPYSIWVNLAMLASGAGGLTKRKLEKVLGLGRHERQHLRDRVYDSLESRVELNVLNSVWRQAGLELSEDAQDSLRQSGAHLAEADFRGQPEAAISAINTWVATETHGRVTELVGPTDLTSQTIFVPVDACYLKAGWAKPFDPEATKPGKFRCQSGPPVTVPMMFDLPAACSALAWDDLHAVELFYVDPRFSMLIIVPVNLRHFEAKLSDSRIRKIWQAVYPGGMISLAMPKFILEQKLTLRPVLENLSLARLFNERANLHGYSNVPGFHIDDVFHASFVDVDEIGTEAGAATLSGGVMGMRTVKVQSPFWFFIQDSETDCILFAGRVEDPSQNSTN